MSNPQLERDLDVRREVFEAEGRIRDHIRETPLEYSPYLSHIGNCRIYLKLENIQLTGSFKLRGAVNKLLSLSKEELKKGVVIASTGNHSIALAYLLKKFCVKGTIYLPKNASQSNIELLHLYGANIKFHETDAAKTESYAREEAAKNDSVFISPYNDLKIIGGQGTIGIELRKQLNQIDTVLAPIGGGGLMSGIAGYLKFENEKIEIIGCQPKNSAIMYESVKAGKIVEMESKSTLSDATVGGIENGSITFDICKKYVDDYILVSESDIRDAIKLFLEKHYMLIEGAAALSLAAFIKHKDRFTNKNVVLIVSGNKSIIEKFKEIILD